MNLFYTDFDKRFMAEFHRQKAEEDAIALKARNFDILMGASKREIETMWDVMSATGCDAQPLIDALARKQEVAG